MEEFLPIKSFKGTIKILNGKSVEIKTGAGLFTHAVQAIKPHTAACQWNVYLLVDINRNAILHMIRWKITEKYSQGQSEVRMGAYIENGKVIAITSDDNEFGQVIGSYDPVSKNHIPVKSSCNSRHP